MTLASPFSGAQAGADARTVANLLHSLYGLCGRILGALGKVSETNAGRLDVFDEQRLVAAQLRLGSLTTVAEELSTTITALLDAPPPVAIATPEQPGSEPTGAPATVDGNATGNDVDDANGGEVGDGEDDPELTIAGAGAESADADDEDEATGKATSMPDDPEPEPLNHRSSDSGHASGVPGASATAPVPAVASAVPVSAVAPDRVVYLREDGELGRVGLEGYRFSIVSSPILLPNDTNWQAFTATFRRIGLLSATLQVQTPGKDSWAYVRGRLGLLDARAHVVGGPFDYDRQARLVALSDFPSWAEQPKQAMRTVAHQLSGWADQVVHRRGGDGPWMGGAMVLTTAKAAAAGIADEVLQLLAHSPDPVAVHSQVLLGTRRAVAEFTGPAPHQGGFLVGTRGLWTGVDVSEPDRMNLVWINKLPFPVFTDPVVAARREQVRRAAEDAGSDDPDLVATGEYYLPLAALDLRQAVGRLLRNSGSRGVVVISDRKLSGDLPLRRLYRQLFLGSLDAGLHVADPDTGEATGGNVMPMAQAWQRIWDFVHGNGLITSAQQQMLTDPDALERHTVLPSTLAIRQLALTPGQVERLRSSGTLTDEVLDRCAQAASLLAGKALTLKPEQRTAIAATAEGRDVLALLPTGAGKSFCFQLPALVLPGLTVVISPLVSLMHDQALSLNHTIGGAVRALVGSLPESSSRAGRTEVVEQMTGVKDHKIRLVYVSPERLSQARFRDALTKGVADGHITRVAIDEAHTYVQWGEDFRPSFRRAGALLRTLRETYPGVLTLITLTATATPTVEQALREEVLGGLVGPATRPPDASPVSGAACTSRHLEVVRVNPLRPELTLVRRTLRTRGRSAANALAEQVLDAATGHTLIYCLTVREVEHVYAHLRDYLAGRPVMLRKFHGRMTEVEKAAVSGEFSEAAKIGQEGYAPMVVVATSAFGLGVSRDDIRNVLCLSPPTDLAALYQQLGRGGRDSAGADVIKLSTPTYALALATSKSLDTAQWLASLDLPLNLLREFASAVLAAVPSGALDVAEASERLLSAHVRSGRLSVAEARERRTRDAWRVGLTRAVAALADLGVVIDHGDVPARVALTAGTRKAQDAFAQRVLDAVLALPARAATPGPTRVSAALTDLLASWLTDPALLAVGFSAACSNVADLWLLLSDLHDTGVIEVSQRPNTHMLVGLGPAGPGPVKGIPSGFDERVSGKLGRAAAEAAHLRAFFAAGTQCLNARLADYFSVPTPAACCSTDLVRCNVCAVGPAGSGINVDSAAGALANGRLRPASFDPRVRAGRVDDAVVRLLRGMFNGATLLQMRLVLRGEDRIWSRKHSSYRKLSPRLTDSSMFGHVPALTDRELTASLQRLVTARSLVADGVYWRTAANFSRGPRRVRPARSSALPAHPSPPGTTAILSQSPPESKDHVCSGPGSFNNDGRIAMTGIDLHVSALSRGYLPAGLVTDDLCAGELPAILDFLVAAAAQRGGSLSIPVAWNCLALGYDLRTGQYSSEFLDWEALPVIALDDEIELLPTGALAAFRTGGGQVPCEVVHREGDHPLLSPDGSCPAWLSGAPAGLDASPRHLQDLPEGPTVAPERLVLDAFALGSERRQSLRRLTGRWLGAFGHLSVRTRYASPEQAEMPEARLYTSYLLTRQKPLLEAILTGAGLRPAGTSDWTEAELAEALLASLSRVDDLLTLAGLVRWREQAVHPEHYERFTAGRLTLTPDDVRAFALSSARLVHAETGRRSRQKVSSTAYIAIGSFLRDRCGGRAEDQFTGPAYPTTLAYRAGVADRISGVDRWGRPGRWTAGACPSGRRLAGRWDLACRASRGPERTGHGAAAATRTGLRPCGRELTWTRSTCRWHWAGSVSAST